MNAPSDEQEMYCQTALGDIITSFLDKVGVGETRRRRGTRACTSPGQALLYPGGMRWTDGPDERIRSLVFGVFQ